MELGKEWALQRIVRGTGLPAIIEERQRLEPQCHSDLLTSITQIELRTSRLCLRYHLYLSSCASLYIGFHFGCRAALIVHFACRACFGLCCVPKSLPVYALVLLACFCSRLCCLHVIRALSVFRICCLLQGGVLQLLLYCDRCCVP